MIIHIPNCKTCGGTQELIPTGNLLLSMPPQQEFIYLCRNCTKDVLYYDQNILTNGKFRDEYGNTQECKNGCTIVNNRSDYGEGMVDRLKKEGDKLYKYFFKK